jgi:hypothetical protein
MPLDPDDLKRHLDAYDQALSFAAKKKKKEELVDLDRFVLPQIMFTYRRTQHYRLPTFS